MDGAPWTLSELAEEVAAVLRGYEAAANGQVRAVPDERSIRYYTTLGLIDRPAAMRGRTALYGKRHLAQVVAIKRLQSAGRTLAEIDAILPGLDDPALAHISGIGVPRRPAPAPARPDFWRNAPARHEPPVPAARPEPPAPAPRHEPPATASPPPPAPLAPARVHKLGKAALAEPPRFAARVVLELAPGVTIVIDPGRPATEADAEAALAAARPLIAELRRRHLIPAEPHGPANRTEGT
jgi:DNA-binding transcriptional MerR regulator